MRSLISIVLLVVAFIPCVQADDGAPIALHPDNPRYFVWRNRPTILVTSGEHYGAVLNGAFDFVAYLDELQKHGLNNTRTFSGVYREVPSSFGITDNTLAPHPGQFICPWARSDQPGESDGGNKFDLRRWNDAYFARLKTFVQAASKRGVIVELDLFCPMYADELWIACPMNARNNIQGIGKCGKDEVYALKHTDLTAVQLEFTRKVVAELNEFDNLYYEVCNEPYFGGVTMEWQHRVIDAIVQVEEKLPRKHLISLNIANGRQQVADPHPAVSIFNFHYCHPPDTVAMNYGLNKPIGENETGFRGQDDLLYRTEGWDFVMAGGALYNNLDYSFTTAHPAGTLRGYQSPGGGSVELRRQLGILKRFVDGLEFLSMKPDVSIVKRPPAAELSVQALAKDGETYAIYFHVPLPGKPKDIREHMRQGIRADVLLAIPRADYAVEWLDTKTGQSIASESSEWTADGLRLISPPFDNDIALKIQRRTRD